MNSKDLIDGVTVIFAFIALIVSSITFWVTRKTFNRERIHKLTDRLFELDKVLLHSPELQKFLYERAHINTPYFVESTQHDNLYFKTKAFVYYHLNYFDEIFCVVEGDRFLEKAFEFEDWKNYIIRKMRHPLFKEVFNRESSIWGEKFRKYINDNRQQLEEGFDLELF